VTIGFIQVAECCPMCGAEVARQNEVARGRQKHMGDMTRGRSVVYEWRECSYCGWKSEKMKMITTWAASDVSDDFYVCSRPAKHSFTR